MESVSEYLRETAALMRGGAEAAEPSLPWELASDNHLALPMLTMRNPTQDQVRYTPVGGWSRYEVAGPSDAVTEHIASWHPDVALSMAYAMEQHAEQHSPSAGRNECIWEDFACGLVMAARAYRGEQP